ncbi:MucR family transcriptional regulator [Mesorhizobium sp. M1339]|uniref:MucR family transcriptional regulator n=1 Tax=unclassified Mesorhizobium TaxID=325217 RepID=UPI003336AB4A
MGSAQEPRHSAGNLADSCLRHLRLTYAGFVKVWAKKSFFLYRRCSHDSGVRRATHLTSDQYRQKWNLPPTIDYPMMAPNNSTSRSSWRRRWSLVEKPAAVEAAPPPAANRKIGLKFS